MTLKRKASQAKSLATLSFGLSILMGTTAPAQVPPPDPIGQPPMIGQGQGRAESQDSNRLHTTADSKPSWLKENSTRLAAIAKHRKTLIQEPVIGDYRSKSVQQTVEEISRQIELPILIDSAATEQLKGAPIGNTQAWFKKPVSARVALTSILAPHGLGFRIEQDMILISPIETQDRFERRYYDLSWILPEGSSIEVVHHAILSCSQGEWATQGGNEKIAFVGPLMIVMGTETTHAAIEELLSQMGRIDPKNFLRELPSKVDDKQNHPQVQHLAQVAPQPQPQAPPAGNPGAPIPAQPNQAAVMVSPYATKMQPMIVQKWTKPDGDPPAWARPREPLTGENRTRNVLRSSQVHVDFHEVPLNQVIQSLADEANVNVVINESSLNDASISVDQTITLQLKGTTTLGECLRAILSPLEMTYVPKVNRIEIASIDEAKATSLCSFDLSHIYPDNSHTQQLVTAIMGTIEANWEIDGGTDTIYLVGPLMIVRAPEPTIEDIEQFLSQVANVAKENWEPK